MRRLEEIQTEERQLYSKEEALDSEANQVRRIKETYDQHLYEAKHFFDAICYQFHKNEQGNVYRALFDEFSQKSRQVMNELEKDEEELRRQKRKLSNQLEDIGYEKRKLLAEEENKT
ncbi:DUF3958 family protein [Enterococcus phoeniculicola]|uniref:Uncharacterized protein n=1 Tax=Enterococcus phoeniculicola ATCC BAA-412 TaxID=1158610 RepID=R3W643_9ENTE|nr:DUF3958 family protein [Enterococcus phoeniculicola]EOL43047.1 hypothetical protein UC3_02024 [Enterococcus phoeniculicola ATCC BAA-412]EOT76595.1 hypothetical protein I589_01552 [Enterococcus phoeniculicola ATCC BAA-412]